MEKQNDPCKFCGTQRPCDGNCETKQAHNAEQKEDKPVIETQSKRTRVHELLGVEVDEVFSVSTFPSTKYKVDQDGDMLYLDEEKGGWIDAPKMTIRIINERETILRRPTLTNEQREVLVALWRLGFKWVSKDEDGGMMTAETEPYRCGVDKVAWTAAGGVCSPGSAMNILRPLIPEWTKPLDIEKKLREAGVGV